MRISLGRNYSSNIMVEDPIREHLRKAIAIARARAAAGEDPAGEALSRAVPEREDDSLTPGQQVQRMLQRLGRQLGDITGVAIGANHLLKCMEVELRTKYKNTTRYIRWNDHTKQFRLTGS